MFQLVCFWLVISSLGSFVPFDTVNGLSGPKTYGFSAGTFEDGTQAYVGYGDNSGCYAQNNCPGRSKLIIWYEFKILLSEFLAT